MTMIMDHCQVANGVLLVDSEADQTTYYYGRTEPWVIAVPMTGRPGYLKQDDSETSEAGYAACTPIRCAANHYSHYALA